MWLEVGGGDEMGVRGLPSGYNVRLDFLFLTGAVFSQLGELARTRFPDPSKCVINERSD